MIGLAKDFKFHSECRKALFKGIEIMYEAVSATLGPNGRTVLLERASHIVEPTKDGVTVADEVYSKDKWEDMGMQLVREAAQKVNTEAGDATTTAIVLAYWLCKKGLDAIRSSSNVYQISRGMKMASDAAVKKLEEIAVSISSEDDYKKVAAISTQDETIGGIIAKTFMEAGENGSIDIQRNEEPCIAAEKTGGMSFEKGWTSGMGNLYKCYLNDLQKRRFIQEDIPILVVDKKVENQNQLIPILETLAMTAPPRGMTQEDFEESRCGWPTGTRKLLVVSDNFSGDALGFLVANNGFSPQLNGRYFHLAYVNAPSYGGHKAEIMQDICAMTGANFISEEYGGTRIERAMLRDLGRAKRVIIEDERTIILADENEKQQKAIKERVELLKSQLKDLPKDHMDYPEVKTRLATLTDGISVIKVGADSEVERNELRRRVDDGVRAVASAREEGVTPGCGIGYLMCLPSIDNLVASNKDQQIGMDIVKQALHSITMRILEVAFVENFNRPWWKFWRTPQRDRIRMVEEMKRKGDYTGYDFSKDDYGDMMALGVFDAKKAIRIALQSAVSVAMMFLKVEVAIAEQDMERAALEVVRDMLLPRMPKPK